MPGSALVLRVMGSAWGGTKPHILTWLSRSRETIEDRTSTGMTWTTGEAWASTMWGRVLRWRVAIWGRRGGVK